MNIAHLRCCAGQWAHAKAAYVTSLHVIPNQTIKQHLPLMIAQSVKSSIQFHLSRCLIGERNWHGAVRTVSVAVHLDPGVYHLRNDLTELMTR